MGSTLEAQCFACCPTDGSLGALCPSGFVRGHDSRRVNIPPEGIPCPGNRLIAFHGRAVISSDSPCCNVSVGLDNQLCPELGYLREIIGQLGL